MIWYTEPSLDAVNAMSANTAVSTLGIEFTEVGDDYLRARMPVDHRHVQPMRRLHGGVSVVLAETMGSVGAVMCIDPGAYTCVGLEVNANHIRGVREGGAVEAVARPLHIGRSTQVWEVRITDASDGSLVSVCRLTVSVLPQR